jgi:hypothetical protein
MKNKILMLIILLLMFWMSFLIRENKNLSQLNLHAERSIREIELSKNISADLHFLSVDSLLPVSLNDELIYIVNRGKNIESFLNYLKTCFPDLSVSVIGNASGLIHNTSLCTEICQLPHTLNIPYNILIFTIENKCQHVIVYEPDNPWLLNSDLKILRKYYEEKK